MPKQKAKKVTRNPVVEQLYDALMGEIEPELTSRNLPLLADIYAEETSKEACSRAERYREAFEKYLELWGAFTARCAETFQQLKARALESLKEQSAREDASRLSALEEEFGTA